MKRTIHTAIIGAAVPLLLCNLLLGVRGQQISQAPMQPGISPQTRLRSSEFGIHRPSEADVALHHALYGKEYQLLQEGKDLYRAGNLRGAEGKLLASLAAAPSVAQHPEPEAETMLGQICLRERRYQEAIPRLLASNPYINDDARGLGLTVAYAHLGDYAQAKRYYNDHIMQRITIADPPGNGDLYSLEASALLELSINDRIHADRDNSLTHLLAAEQLAPQNVTIAYYTGKALAEKGRDAEAISRFQKVVASPRGSVFSEARSDLSNAKMAAAHR